MTEDEMVGWHHQLNGHEFEQTQGDGERYRSQACWISWGSQRVRHDLATQEQPSIIKFGASLVAKSVKKLPATQETACNSEDEGSISGPERSSGEGNSNPLQYSCLGNSMERRARQAIVHGVAKSWRQLSDQAHTHLSCLFLRTRRVCLMNAMRNRSNIDHITETSLPERVL